MGAGRHGQPAGAYGRYEHSHGRPGAEAEHIEWPHHHASEGYDAADERRTH